MPMNIVPQIDEELKNLIPPLSPDEYNALEQSILKDGCRDDLTVWGETLIDGHNRLEICLRHNIPYTVNRMHFDSKTDVVLWMIQNQLARRNLTPFARAELVARSSGIVDRLKEEARQRMLATLNQGDNRPAVQNFAQREKTRDTLSQLADVSHETFRKVQMVSNQAPETIKQLARKGELSTDNAYKITKALQTTTEPVKEVVEKYGVTDAETINILDRLARQKRDSFDEVLNSGYIQLGDEEEAVHISDSALKVKDAINKKAFIHRELARQEAQMTPPPTGKYRTIVIDPPWHVEKIERDLFPNQGKHLDYPTMTLDEIKALPVSDLADDVGCHLYLWTTHKYLPDALELVKHWGFNYQCVMTWVKPSGFTPFSWMYNTELIVFARRGDLPIVRMGMKIHFEAPNPVHSAKPDVFYDRVAQASPEPRIDMFARKPREGFTVWGNEVQDE